MIIRANHSAQERFFLFRRATAQDQRLSARSLGVLTFLLSKPDGWELSITQLRNHFADLGRDSAYAVVKEFIQNGYARRVQERSPDGAMGRVRIDVYEMPLTVIQEAVEPLPGLPEAVQPLPGLPDTAEPLPGLPDTANQEHIRNRAPQETEPKEKQSGSSKDAAAASRFTYEQIRDFVIATKFHAKNPGGLAKLIWMTGDEDDQVSTWLKREEFKKTSRLNSTPFDGWVAERAREAESREAQAKWLTGLDSETYRAFFDQAADDFAQRFPQHATRKGWKESFKSTIEKLIIVGHYPEEISA